MTRSLGVSLERGWRRLVHIESGSFFGPTVAGLALLGYLLVAVAFPLDAGRDLQTYLRAAFELRSREVVLPQAMLGRAPVTGVFAESVLSLGSLAAEIAMAAAYVLSILCWWRVARRAGAAVGIVVTAILLVFPGYALLFHRLSSDALFAAAFALAALLTARFVGRPTSGRAAAVGAAISMLVLVRPVSQVLLVLVPLALFLPDPWRRRLGRTALVGAAAVVPLVAWATHNGLRADDFTIVRGGGHAAPLYRAFVVEGIVDPNNGAATRELARVLEDDLLTREPYRSYGIGIDEFFESRSARMHEDLAGVSDRTWGWDDDYEQLGRVGREAVLAHPAAYARGVARDTWRLLWWPVFLPIEVEDAAPPTSDPDDAAPSTTDPDGGNAPPHLPVPSEGQPIPSASVSGFISTPDGRFREVWTSPTEHVIVANDPADARHLHLNNVRVDELSGAFSDRSQNATLGTWLNRASRWFPRPIVWLVLGLGPVALRRPRSLTVPLTLSVAGLLVIVGTALAVPATAEYATPVVPAFVLLAAFGLLAERELRGGSSVPR